MKIKYLNFFILIIVFSYCVSQAADVDVHTYKKWEKEVIVKVGRVLDFGDSLAIDRMISQIANLQAQDCRMRSDSLLQKFASDASKINSKQRVTGEEKRMFLQNIYSELQSSGSSSSKESSLSDREQRRKMFSDSFDQRVMAEKRLKIEAEVAAKEKEDLKQREGQIRADEAYARALVEEDGRQALLARQAAEADDFEVAQIHDRQWNEGHRRHLQSLADANFACALVVQDESDREREKTKEKLQEEYDRLFAKILDLRERIGQAKQSESDYEILAAAGGKKFTQSDINIMKVEESRLGIKLRDLQSEIDSFSRSRQDDDTDQDDIACSASDRIVGGVIIPMKARDQQIDDDAILALRLQQEEEENLAKRIAFDQERRQKKQSIDSGMSTTMTTTTTSPKVIVDSSRAQVDLPEIGRYSLGLSLPRFSSVGGMRIPVGIQRPVILPRAPQSESQARIESDFDNDDN